MNTLIIEDEYPAANRLQQLLQVMDPSLKVLGVLESVKAARYWLSQHAPPDLIFSDIQLADGLSFEIFESVPVSSPIIFTTAFDEYAIRAFKVKSVDYLLKPVKAKELEDALVKFRQMREVFAPRDAQAQIQELFKLIQAPQPQDSIYKDRFLVKYREEWVPMKGDEIAFFSTAHEVVYLHDLKGKKYVVEYTLEQLEQMLDPQKFYRINRQFIGHLQSIQRIHTYFNGRLKLQLQPEPEEEVIVSRDKARAFKAWMGG